jgi:hypothetical protein
VDCKVLGFGIFDEMGLVLGLFVFAIVYYTIQLMFALSKIEPYRYHPILFGDLISSIKICNTVEIPSGKQTLT